MQKFNTIKEIQEALDFNFFTSEYKVLTNTRYGEELGIWLDTDGLTETVRKYIEEFTNYEFQNVKPVDETTIRAFFRRKRQDG